MSDPEKGCGILAGCAAAVAAWVIVVALIWAVPKLVAALAGAFGW